MVAYPHIDPVLIHIGPLQIRWYGLMYVLGFIACYLLVKIQSKKFGLKNLQAHLDNLNLAIILGVILGGRLGYVLFYNPAYYLRHPLEIFATWQGGMSFHGGCIGVLVAGFYVCRKHGLDYWKTADLFVVTVPIGLALGRIGNFINGELYGRVTSLPWGMIFPEGGLVPRHPSQLYEAFLEGVVLFVILWNLKEKPWQRQHPWPHGSLVALFLCLYGLFRFLVEFVREPDPQLGLFFLDLSMGQLLSIAMFLAGIILFLIRKKASSPPGQRKRGPCGKKAR
jgi:phosphatidylglycerol:prolipoprotein diacylglycerol transferase